MLNNIATFILNNIPFPMWIKDLDKNTIFVNEEFKKIYKQGNGETFNLEQHVCTKCSMKKICCDKVDEVISSKKAQSFIIDIGKKYNKCYISPYFDLQDELMGVMAILVDITESVNNQNKAEERENILRTIIDTLPDYIFYKDKECKYVGYNKKWKDHYEDLGIPSMIGKDDVESGAVPASLAKKFIEQDKRIMKSKKITVSERTIVDENGKRHIEETRKVPVISENGDVWGIVGLSSDITEKIETKEKLIKLSYTDSLTEVYNRACFEDKKEELNHDKYLPIGIIMGDVNGLKVVNDTFGHLEGDRLLKEIANVLKSVTNEKDYIFRWGGDEFIILMPNCDEDKCEKTIRSIIKECKGYDFNLIDMSISLGASIKSKLEEDIYVNLKEAE
ncbi:MAG: sensor domain-containing diguanylate cyclase, partial [Peptostreptococcaceae bacterium]